MNPVSVLVTGSNGFIGRHVTNELEALGHRAVGYDHPRDVRHFRRSTLGDEIGAVIHLAGILGTSELVAADHGAVEVNINGALRVADACAEAGIPLVYIATGHRGQPNTYAITKACAEDLLLARARWLGHPVSVVRAFHVYGPGQKPCEPHGTSPVRKIVPSFVCRALTNMTLQINGTGDQLIDLVHVRDVARCLVDAIDGPYGEITEAGTGIATSVASAALDVIAETKSRSRFEFVPMRAGEPEYSEVVAKTGLYGAADWLLELPGVIDWYRDYLRR